MSVFINSKKALEFKGPGGVKHNIPSNYIGTVPDWVPETWLYKAACKDGSITFIGEQKAQIVIEKPENVSGSGENRNDSPKKENETPDGENDTMEEKTQQEDPPEPPVDPQAQQETVSEELLQLRERAKELGIKSYQNMKEETLKQRIATAEAELEKTAVSEADENQMALDGATTEERQ